MKRGKVIDYAMVEKLAMIQCTMEEIGSCLGLTAAALQRDAKFCDLYKTTLAKGRTSLRRMQWKAVQEGSATMLAQMIKQYLGAEDDGPVDEPRPGPTTYTPALAEAICRRLAAGQSLGTIGKTPGFPGRRTIHRWLATKADFRERYNVARDLGIDAMVEEGLRFARSADETNANARRGYLDFLKFYVSKIAPSRYGDRVEVAVNVTASIGDAIEEGRRRLAKLRGEESILINPPRLTLEGAKINGHDDD